MFWKRKTPKYSEKRNMLKVFGGEAQRSYETGNTSYEKYHYVSRLIKDIQKDLDKLEKLEGQKG